MSAAMSAIWCYWANLHLPILVCKQRPGMGVLGYGLRVLTEEKIKLWPLASVYGAGLPIMVSH